MASRPDDRVLLTEWASRFVGGPHLLYTEVVTRFYPDGSSEQTEPRPVHSTAGAPTVEACGERFAAIYPLYRYRFPDGRVVREFLQAVARDERGTLIYLLALEDDAGKWIIDSMWSAAAIAAKRLTVMTDSTK